MRLSKVLLVAGAGVLVYKALKIIVKLQVPREVAELDLFVGDISRAMFDYSEDIEAGEDKEKAIEKFVETLGVGATKVEVTDEAINLHFENAKDKVNAAIEKEVNEVQEATDEAKKLIEEYHENYKEVTV